MMWEKIIALADYFRIDKSQAKKNKYNYQLITQILIAVIVVLALTAGYWRVKYVKLEEKALASSEMRGI